MAPFSRRRLRAADRTRLDLRPGDSVLVSTELADGRWAVASRRALHLLGPEGTAVRHPWSDADHGSLDPATRTMSLRWVWGDTERLTFAEVPGSFAFSQTFRERVQQSVVHAVSVTLPDGRRARVVLRRDEDGTLFTQVLGDSSIDLTDPAVAAVVDAAEDEVRDAAGLPR